MKNFVLLGFKTPAYKFEDEEFIGLDIDLENNIQNRIDLLDHKSISQEEAKEFARNIHINAIVKHYEQVIRLLYDEAINNYSDYYNKKKLAKRSLDELHYLSLQANLDNDVRDRLLKLYNMVCEC